MEQFRSKHKQTQSEWEAEMSKKVLEFVRSELYMDLRFLDIALGTLVYRADENIRSFATDGTYLYFSTEQVLRVFQSNPKYLDRAYLHSVLHCIFFHLWIGGKRDREKWNLACDIAVEYTKEEQKNAANEDARKQWDKIARQTRMEKESRGDETEDGEEILAAQLKAEKSRQSYADFLRKFSVLREELHADPDEFDLNYYTYGLRLYGNMPLIEPVESREVKKIQEFVIVVDTSYSTSGELIHNFLKETYAILTEQNSFFAKSRIRIIQCDNQVRMDEEVKNSRELEQLLNRFTVIGGGGTDFRPAFAYVNELLGQGVLKNPGGLLYFTDGKGIYPKKRPEYKTAFLFLDDYDESAVPPWAMRLRVE